jgi:hypothetical protein
MTSAATWRQGGSPCRPARRRRSRWTSRSARIHGDEDELVEDLVKDYPAFRFDYGRAHLQDALSQDKDYEGLLAMRSPLGDDEAEQWFEEFSNIAPRDRRRVFRG